MPLVDYDTSDDESTGEDEEDKSSEEIKEDSAPAASPSLGSLAPPSLASHLLPNRHRNESSAVVSHPIPDATPLPPPSTSLPPPSFQGLPDVSSLFASPSLQSHQIAGSDHSSRAVSAMKESASRKRESNGSDFPRTSSKHPRGQPSHLRNAPDTAGGLLIPPQLRGRSNVVTEDIGKLFVNKPAEPSR